MKGNQMDINEMRLAIFAEVCEHTPPSAVTNNDREACLRQYEMLSSLYHSERNATIAGMQKTPFDWEAIVIGALFMEKWTR